jgi:acetyltransferase-like isoleucine patch superfamily enzyme
VNLRRFLAGLIPAAIKLRYRRRVDALRRRYLAPRMLWGYENVDGSFHADTRVSDTVFLYHPERITLAGNVFVWHYSILDGTGGLEIGEGTQIGAWVGIFTHSSHIAIRLYGRHYQEIAEEEKLGYPVAPVKIGRYVFVGAGSKVLPGVTIGDGALVSAGSLVTRDVGTFEIVAGAPAKVIGSTRKLDLPFLKENEQLRTWHQEWSGQDAWD